MRLRFTLTVLQTLLAGVGLLSTVFVAGSAQSSSLALVSTAWSPFTNEPGAPRFALDLVEAAFGRMGISSSSTIVPAPEFTGALLGGRFDGSAAAWRDASRERLLIFSDPYLENRLMLVGRRGSEVSATTFAALRDKRIAIVEGYSYGDEVENSGAIFVRSATEEANLTALLNGAVDYTLMDELVVRYIISTYPKESKERLVFGREPLVVRPLALAIRRERPDAEAIVRRFNAQLRAMITDRSYHRLLHVDWIHADVDGDGVKEYVAARERVGPTPPQDAYAVSLATTATPATTPVTRKTQTGFYIGGTLYSDWASVPQSYKVPDNEPVGSGRSAASIFTFRW
jgi:polar amino acid transport system substrate-binding protein